MDEYDYVKSVISYTLCDNSYLVLLKCMTDDTDQLNENENASLCVDVRIEGSS